MRSMVVGCWSIVKLIARRMLSSQYFVVKLEVFDEYLQGTLTLKSSVVLAKQCYGKLCVPDE